MATPKYGVAYTFYIALVSQSNTKLFQSNPTLATGDFTITKDGGASANLATLPVVTPASSRRVKVVLSATEMEATDINIMGVDASGSEWCDISISIQTNARALDDLAYPATSGRSLAVDASGQTTVGAIAANAITATAINTDAITAAKIADGAIDAATFAAGAITAAAIATDAIDADALAADAIEEINATVDTALADYDAPTKAELDSGLAALNDLSASEVNAEVLDVLTVDTFAEVSGVPAATSTLKDKINWLFALARNRITQTATTQTLRDDSNTLDVATSSVSDNGTTAVRDEWS